MSIDIVPIGRGLCRVRVKSEAKRAALAKFPEVEVHGFRVIFPERLYGAVKGALLRKSKKRRQRTEQGKMEI